MGYMPLWTSSQAILQLFLQEGNLVIAVFHLFWLYVDQRCRKLIAVTNFVTSWVTIQDDYAIQSFERGIAAQNSGAFAWEIVPVSTCFTKAHAIYLLTPV